jgi:acyl carrier protein
MIALTPEQVYRDLGVVMGSAFPDRDIDAAAGPDTKIFRDLGLASIELIVLGERLEQFYSKKLPFGPFLADLRNRGADDLELGELVSFLMRHANR